MDRVHFTAPMLQTDLRVVLAAHTASKHDRHEIEFTTQFGEIRRIPWLTYSEAMKRGAILRARGYSVVITPMVI